MSGAQTTQRGAEADGKYPAYAREGEGESGLRGMGRHTHLLIHTYLYTLTYTQAHTLTHTQAHTRAHTLTHTRTTLSTTGREISRLRARW